MQKTVIKAVPFVSVNGIEFGTSREKIRETLGKPEYSFFKDDDKIETDIFGCFHIFYDADYRFEAIEVVYVDETEIYYDGIKVPQTYNTMLSLPRLCGAYFGFVKKAKKAWQKTDFPDHAISYNYQIFIPSIKPSKKPSSLSVVVIGTSSPPCLRQGYIFTFSASA